jgi:MFS family permease
MTNGIDRMFSRVPISTSFGRRPVYLFSQLINFGTSIWRAKATSYSSFMGACVVNGIGAGPAETIMPAVIADIYFLHDRGKWNTLYWVVYMGSLMVGPIINGAMVETVGWRNFWWFNTGLLGLSFIMVVFMFPETKYQRAHAAETAPVEKISTPSSTEKVQLEHNDPAARPADTTSGEIDHVPTTNSVLPNTEGGLTHEETAARDPYLGKGTPSKSQWMIFQPNAHPFKSIFLDLWIPWKLFAFPIVEFASFVVSWSCSSFLTLNLTQSQAFAAPPYNFKPLSIGTWAMCCRLYCYLLRFSCLLLGVIH